MLRTKLLVHVYITSYLAKTELWKFYESCGHTFKDCKQGKIFANTNMNFFFPADKQIN